MKINPCPFLVLLTTFVLGAARCGLADDCNPTLGDQVYDWVLNSVPQQSRNLAKADYEARVFNYFLIESGDIETGLLRVSGQINALGDNIRQFEAGAATDQSEMALVRSAVKRERDCQDVLDQLFDLKAQIDDLTFRKQALTAPVTLASFRAAGLENVGRSTLVESLREIGDREAHTLAGKFSFYLSVSVDSSGNFQQATLKPAEDVWDTVALGLAAELGNPYVWAAFVTFEVTRLIINDDACRKKIEIQKQKLDAAIKLLPEKLITREEQVALYQTTYVNCLQQFSEPLSNIESLLQNVRGLWASVLAYNGTREAVAHTLLTEARVQMLQTNYGQNEAITEIFNNTLLTNMARDIQALNSYVAVNEAKLLLSDKTLTSLDLLERQSDSLLYSEKSYAALLELANFAPLHGFLNSSLTDIQALRTEVGAVKKGWLSHTAQAVPMANTVLNLRTARLGRQVIGATTKEARQQVLRSPRMKVPLFAEIQSGKVLSIRTFSAFDTDTPYVVAGGDGGHYEVVTSGASGNPYSNQFYAGSGYPSTDVLGGANDGGYARDNRQIAADLAAASGNIDQRIRELQERLKSVQRVLPKWIEKNSASLKGRAASTDAWMKREERERATFSQAFSGKLEGAQQAITDFLASPFDPSRIAGVIRAVGGASFSLPDLPMDALDPNAPAIGGFSAFQRIYGSVTDRTDREIFRERLKAKRELAGNPQQLALGNSELDLARQFASSRSAKGREMAMSLVRDAESLRYFEARELATAEISVVRESGAVEQIPLQAGSPLPADSLLSRGPKFEASMAAFHEQLSSLRASLGSGVGTAGRQLEVAGTAEHLAQVAGSDFFSGDIPLGERLLGMAHSVLDVATRFIPGVNLGRDIYEAISGTDLFSGEKLDAIARTMAVVGVLTLGLEDEFEGSLKAMREVTDLGISGERAEEIEMAARTIDRKSVSMGPHVREEMLEEPLGEISQTELYAAIDSGTRFWDDQRGTLVAFENDQAPGEVRVAVGIDINNKKIVTAYREKRDDEKLAKVVYNPGDEESPLRRLRFWRLSRKDNF